MRSGNLLSITQYFFIVVFAVMLPLHCMVHCAQHDTPDQSRFPFVCILNAAVSQSHTQLAPHPSQPSATHEAVSFLFVHTVFVSEHTRFARSIHTQKQLHYVRPDFPPPRRHALSVDSL